MVDDIRPSEKPKKPETPKDETQNKQVELETSHHYEEAGDFVAINNTKKSKTKQSRMPSFIANASKKQKIGASVIAALILIGGGGGAYALTKKGSTQPTASTSPTVQNAEPAVATKSSTEVSRLTGAQIAPELNKRPVTSIQIENSPDARPQSGLKDAGVIFEAVAEGGITRFNASFLEAQPDYIGPVRSVRPYYAALAAPFDPVFVHAGGSADGLAKLKSLGLKDLDFGPHGSTFQRISSRPAPHNLYTSTASLDKTSQSLNFTTSDVKSIVRKEEQKGLPITAKTINLTLSSALYNVHYDYDAASNTYLRSEGGKPHTDERSKQQLAPKVVVALVMKYSQNGIYSVYQTTGSGKAVVFQDGTAVSGTWSKAGDKDQFVFKKDDGSALPLDAGQTWFTLISSPTNVTSAP